MTRVAPPRPARRWPTWFPAAALVGLVAVTAVIANMLPAGPAAFVRGADGLAAVLALVYGARRERCTPTWAWSLMAAGIAAWVAGDALWDGLDASGANPSSGWYTVANVLYIITYPILFAALLGLVGNGWRGSLDDVIDSVVLAVAAVLLLRLFVAEGGHSLNALDAVFNAAYPLGDALLLGAMAWLLFTAGVQSVPAWLLTSGILLMLATDSVWDAINRYGLDWLLPWVNPAYPIAYALIASAAVHPAAARMGGRRRVKTRAIRRGRLVFLCGSLAVLTLVALQNSTHDMLVKLSVVVLVAAVALRFAALVGATEEAYRDVDRSERRFRMLATFVPVGILEADVGPEIIFANEEAERLFGSSLVGYGPDELLGLVSEAADPDELRTTTAGVQTMMSGGRANAQIRVRSADGQERWVAWYGMPAGDAGETGAFVATVDITALKEAEALLALQATHDSLTGLPNRRLLFDRLSRAVARISRHPGLVGVLFMDLDAFKPVNDLFGHDAGDQLLETIAGRLQSAVRAEDTVARVGGDEFVVVLDNVSDPEDIARVAAKIVEVAGEPVQLGQGEAVVGASIGIALTSDPQHDPDALLRDADTAMYAAKESGGNQYRFFHESMTEDKGGHSIAGKRHHVNVSHRSKSSGG